MYFSKVFGLKLKELVTTKEIEQDVPKKKYNKEKYHLYLASREWWVKRQAVMKRAGGLCEICKKNKATAVHHRTYARVYKELLTDLQAICQSCHDYIHAR